MDRKTIRSRFSSDLAKLQAVAVWYSPSEQRIFARSLPCDESTIHRNQRGRKAIPTDAIRIGQYHHPCASLAFLDDLDEALRCHRIAQGTTPAF